MISKYIRFIKYYFLLFFSFLIFFSCATNSGKTSSEFSLDNQDSYIPRDLTWSKIKNSDYGEYYFFENKAFPLRYHCVKIDLTSRNLSIVAYPNSNADYIYKNNEGSTILKGIDASEFFKRTNSSIIINTSPYDIPSLYPKLLSYLSQKRKICGVHKVAGIEFSPPVNKYSAISFGKDDKGWYGIIMEKQKPQLISKEEYSFGGFFQILSDSKVINFSVKRNDSRTALGLSADGRTLFILCVEGEKSQNSIGLNYEECAQIMLSLGAANALQMDGGGSTSLFINGENILTYPKLRKNAALIGFY